jgi:hypothetical protein
MHYTCLSFIFWGAQTRGWVIRVYFGVWETAFTNKLLRNGSSWRMRRMDLMFQCSMMMDKVFKIEDGSFEYGLKHGTLHFASS